MPDENHRPGAIELSLTPEQVQDFCAALMQEKGITGLRIQALVKERFGVDVGKAAAYTFKGRVFENYRAKLAKRSEVSAFIAAHAAPEDGARIADAASSELAQVFFDFMMTSGAELDLTDEDGREAANTLSLALSRLRRGDHTQRQLEAKLVELEAKNKTALATLTDESQPMETRAVRLKQLFGMAGIVLALCFVTLPTMTKAQRVDELRQKIDAALTAADTTRSMDDEALEAAALANTPGHNVNGWTTPYAEDHPFSLLKEYQFRYAMDNSRFKAGLWGRQTGKDFTTEGEAVADCLLREGTTWMVAAPSERQSLDSLDKAKDWARAFDLAIAGEREVREGTHSQTLLKSAEITFANGSKIVAVPGKPDTVRGKSANILLTEFDFFEDPAATWRAILPSITNPLRGGEKKVRLVTTPNGKGGAMHKIWTREDGKMKWARHLVTVYHAVLHGMPIDIEALREAFGDDADGFAQECLCRFLDGSAVLLPYELIQACESFEASETDTPEILAQSPLRKVAGIDFGRVNDPTVMSLGLQGLGMSLVRNVTKLKGMSTPDQVDTLLPYLKLCDRVCVDYTGPGIGFGDELAKQLGQYDPAKHLFGKVELCTFTLPLKRDIFPALRMAFEKRNIRVPVSSWLREDLHSMAQVITNGQYNYKAPRSDEGHSDGCTSLALMVRAAGAASSPFTWSPAGKSARSVADSEGEEKTRGLGRIIKAAGRAIFG